jgi:TRAP-type transport system small permease protein
MRSLHNALSKSLTVILGTLLVALVSTTLLQVTLRYAFSASLVWAEELSVLLLIWMTWIGAAKLWLDRRHIEVDLFTNSMSSKARQRFDAVCDVLMIAFGIALCVFASKTVDVNTGLELAALKIDSTIKYRPVQVGGAILAIAAILNLFTLKQGDRDVA